MLQFGNKLPGQRFRFYTLLIVDLVLVLTAGGPADAVMLGTNCPRDLYSQFAVQRLFLRNALTATAAEMDVTIWRTSRSTIVRELLRRDPPADALPPTLAELNEPEVVRHYVNLSQLNHAVDTGFYPLGSCTMKYNPKACNQYAMLPELLNRHPLAPESTGQGILQILFELQEMLKEVTGMRGVSLTPMAGAQGEFAGVAMIRAYHRARNDLARTEIIVPDAAHGTNPATAFS